MEDAMNFLEWIGNGLAYAALCLLPIAATNKLPRACSLEAWNPPAAEATMTPVTEETPRYGRRENDE